MKPEKSIEKRSSRTANYTCMCRASSYMETDPFYTSDDYIAVKLLPRFIKFLLARKIVNLRGRISPRGIYSYVVARTRYIDRVFIDAVKNEAAQVLILGAGFDSRAIRLISDNDPVKVFEVDIHTTLEAKQKQYRKRKIPIPGNNLMIPVDFEKEVLADRLTENGYRKEKKTLFILEGLIMYLTEEAVRTTMTTLGELAGTGSLLVFDFVHASVLNQPNTCYGQNSILERVKKDNEMWQFGIDQDHVAEFLSGYQFQLKELLTSQDLENRNFKDTNGRIIARVNGTHCIALAERI